MASLRFRIDTLAFLLIIFCGLEYQATASSRIISTIRHYETKSLNVPVDHFNFVDNRSFPLRYLYNDSFVDKSQVEAPIFFYTGNEGDIELFAESAGFLWELAKQFKAYVVFTEHRYYGHSLPFGKDTFNKTENIGYLSVEQTLEDFVDVITFLKQDKKSPVIVFGGSYGGMLSAWLRMKYPHIVDGALAASAPIWQFNGLTPCDIFTKIITSVFETAYSPNCSLNIQKSWSTFKNFSSTEDGKKQLNSLFKFCDPITKQEDLDAFFDYLEDVYGNLAMVNYPYGNDFLAPLPAYPVRQFCLYLKDEHQGIELLNAMQQAISVYANFTGETKCLNYKSAYDDNLGGKAWGIQTCNEIVMPMCSANNSTMFRTKEWNFQSYSEDCYKKYNIRPRLNDMLLRYGGKDLETASNIIFSNGLLDPWCGGGVLQTPNNNIQVIIIPESAHHLDLFAPNAADPVSVQQARKKETEIIDRWIKEARNKF